MPVKFTIEADGKKAEKEVKSFAKAMNGLGKSTQTAAQQTTKASKKMVAGYAAVAIGIAAIVKGGRALIRFGKEAVAAAETQQSAESKLGAALRARGEAADELLPKLIADATALQRLTGAADDLTLSQQALAVSMGVPVDKLDEFSLAIENATAAGLPAETVMLGLSKAYSGSAATLSRYIPEVAALTKEQLKAGGATDLINKSFGGMAEAMSTTWTGAVRRLKDAYSDLVLEGIGKIVTDAPVLRATLIETSQTFLTMADGVSTSSEVIMGSVDTMTGRVVNGMETIVKVGLRVKQLWRGLRVGVDSYTVQLLENELALKEQAVQAAQVAKTLADDIDSRAAAVENLRIQTQAYARLKVQVDEGRRAVNEGVAAWSETKFIVEDTTEKFDGYRRRIAETADALRNGLVPATQAATEETDKLGESVKTAAENMSLEGGFSEWLDSLTPSEETLARLQLLADIKADAVEKDKEAAAAAKRARDAAEDAAADAAMLAEQQVQDASRIAEGYGKIAGRMVLAKDKNAALREALKQTATTVISQLARMATASIAETAATKAAQIAANVAVLPSATATAVMESAATRGSSAAAGAAAFAAAIAAMAGVATGLISSIGDAGIMDRGGSGRSVVMKQNDEILIDPKGTKKFHKQMDLVNNALGGVADGVLGTLGMGRGGQPIQLTSNTYLDGRLIAESTDTHMADMARTGSGSFLREALVVP